MPERIETKRHRFEPIQATSNSPTGILPLVSTRFENIIERLVEQRFLSAPVLKFVILAVDQVVYEELS